MPQLRPKIQFYVKIVHYFFSGIIILGSGVGRRWIKGEEIPI